MDDLIEVQVARLRVELGPAVLAGNEVFFEALETAIPRIAGPALRYLGIDYANREVIDCGDAVVVRGTARMKLLREPGGRENYVVLFLDVWTRREGQWQMVGWHATRVT